MRLRVLYKCFAQFCVLQHFFDSRKPAIGLYGQNLRRGRLSELIVYVTAAGKSWNAAGGVFNKFGS